MRKPKYPGITETILRETNGGRDIKTSDVEAIITRLDDHYRLQGDDKSRLPLSTITTPTRLVSYLYQATLSREGNKVL